MIIADKIINERKKNGWSQEDLAAELGVSRQSVSKWESAVSVPDLAKVVRMAEIFGVSTDYLLKDELEEADHVETYPEDDTVFRKVSMEEANEFLEMKQTLAGKVSFGVALCILSPTVLIALAGMADDHVGGLSENVAAAAGLLFLFAMIAAAVFTFITAGVKASRMEYLEKEFFETAYGVTGMVKERKRAYEPVFSRYMAIGVVVCIVAVVPLIMAGVADAADWICCILVSLMLALIAGGVYCIVKSAMINGSFDTLLQEGEYSRNHKKSKGTLEAFSGIYWCIVTAVYLGWSFMTMNWQRTWILWPVAGVFYGAAEGAVRVLAERKTEN